MQGRAGCERQACERYEGKSRKIHASTSIRRCRGTRAVLLHPEQEEKCNDTSFSIRGRALEFVHIYCTSVSLWVS